METGPRLKVSLDKLMKPGIEPGTPGLQGKRFIHYTTVAPVELHAWPSVEFVNFVFVLAGLSQMLIYKSDF